MKNDVFNLSLTLLSAPEVKPVLFIASESEVFLAWGESNQSKDLPLCCSRFFTPSQTTNSVWDQFSANKSFTPQHYVFLNQKGEISTNDPHWNTHHHFEARNTTCSYSNENEDFSNWNKYCKEIEERITQGKIEKVVPARTKTLSFSSKISLIHKTTFFQKLLIQSPANVHLFAFKENGDLFIGATPELLFKTDHNELTVPAIAGTKPRLVNNDLNQQMINELISSPKERQEHQYVVDYIENKLKTLGLTPQFSKNPQLLTLKTLQHLQTLIKAPLTNHNINALTILEQLHPTPATAGIPKTEALELIKSFENFTRGLYASPLGYILPNGNSRFVVCLRSLLLKDHSAHLFAGAGFVKGSDSESEWAETSEKMQTMAQLFGKNSA